MLIHEFTVGRVFFPKDFNSGITQWKESFSKHLWLPLLLFFWLKWAGYLAVAGLNLLAQISERPFIKLLEKLTKTRQSTVELLVRSACCLTE